MATIAPERPAETQPSERYEALVLDFLAHLEFERGLSRNTLAAYRTDLLQFGRFLAERDRDATAVEPTDLSDFLADIAQGDGNGAPPARPRRSIARRPACALSIATSAARRRSRMTPRLGWRRRGAGESFRRS
jgi:integrase/recombinase XerD